MRDLVKCKNCGVDTSPIPEKEKYEDWEGLCPPCVIRTFALPKLGDDRLVSLIEALIRGFEEASTAPQFNVLVATEDGLLRLDEALRSVLGELLLNADARKMLREVIDATEESLKQASKDTPKFGYL